MDVDQSEEEISKIRKDYSTKQILFYLTDVTSKSNLEQVFEEVVSKFNSIDCVIACAGVFDELDYERTVNINLVIKTLILISEQKKNFLSSYYDQLGLIHTNYIGLRYMGKDKGRSGGIIVNIASVAGIDCSQFSTPTYNATKHGVVAFSRSFGVSLRVSVSSQQTINKKFFINCRTIFISMKLV